MRVIERLGNSQFSHMRYGLSSLAVAAAAAADCRRRRRRFSRRKVVSGQLDEENPFVQNSSVLLVQADEGVPVLVVDRIGDIYRSLPRRADVIVTTVGSRHKCHQDQDSRNIAAHRPPEAAARGGATTSAIERAGRALVAQAMAGACAPVAHHGRCVTCLVAPQVGRPCANRCAVGRAPLRACWPDRCASVRRPSRDGCVTHACDDGRRVVDRLRAKEAPLRAWHRPLVETRWALSAAVGAAVRRSWRDIARGRVREFFVRRPPFSRRSAEVPAMSWPVKCDFNYEM
ncbi:hypothetical protein F511_42103 [Dorcoceras hygrometricum]|uniref:Uncharacterized protein n=1 Tax=Dorcoceras hygrometricum TaxID=472368 RepID=A0A2Z7B072_9LAMI|nr:hypothetical protein F511_42103 [Dorcoceras hygrometricum]